MTGSNFVRQWALFLWFAIPVVFLAPLTQAQIAITPSSVSFGNVLLGSSQVKTVSISNVGSSNVSVAQVTVSGTGYVVSGLTLPYSLSPGRSVYINVTFTPSATGTDTGSVTAIASMPSSKGSKKWRTSSTNISASTMLSGSGITATGQVAASPTSLSFGNILPGGSQTLTETLSNTGSASIAVSGASMSNASFAVNGLNLPATLAVGQSLTFGVVFSPTASGTISGTLAILSNASNSQMNISLSGTGATAGQLTVSPTTLNFGSVTTGMSASLNGTLSASGSSVTISSATISSTEFVVSGITLPMTLSAGQSALYKVTFQPQATGTASGTLTFVSNAGNSSVAESLSGSGATPVQHSVTLSWAASTSAGIVGYNVYRSGVSGGPYAQVTSMNADLTYTDSAVSAGQTYYYVVSAVDSAGAESVFSNQTQAAIPSP